MTADDTYSLVNGGILTQPIQIQLSQKRKTFSNFFAAFSKNILNLEYFQRKDDSQSPYISEITESYKPG